MEHQRRSLLAAHRRDQAEGASDDVQRDEDNLSNDEDNLSNDEDSLSNKKPWGRGVDTDTGTAGTADADADADKELPEMTETNNSEDDGETSGLSTRVTIPPLLLTLSPTPDRLTFPQVRAIHDAAERALEAYFELLTADGNDRAFLEDGITFSYLKLLGVALDEWVGSDGRAVCGVDAQDATDNACKSGGGARACVYGSTAEEDVCPSGELCFANISPKCGNGKDDGDDRRRLIRGPAQSRAVPMPSRNLATDAYTVIQLAGGIANFRVVAPSAALTERRMGRLSEKAIEKGLAKELAELKDPVFRGIVDVTATPLSSSDAPLFGVPEEGNEIEAEAEETTVAVGPDEPTESIVQPPPTVPSAEETPSTIESGTPPVLNDPPKDSSGTVLPSGPLGPVGGNEGGSALNFKTNTEMAPPNNTPLISGVVIGMVLLTIGLVFSAIALRRHKYRKKANVKGDADSLIGFEQGHKSDLEASGGPSKTSPVLATIRETDAEANEGGSTDESSFISAHNQDEPSSLVSPNELRRIRSPPKVRVSVSEQPQEEQRQLQKEQLHKLLDEDMISISETTVSHADASLGQAPSLRPSESFEIRRHFESITVRKDMMVPEITTGMESRNHRSASIINTELARVPKNIDVEDRGNLMTYPRHLQHKKGRRKGPTTDLKMV